LARKRLNSGYHRAVLFTHYPNVIAALGNDRFDVKISELGADQGRITGIISRRDKLAAGQPPSAIAR
jgi:hypothetical protein